jgi:flavin-dependent dehydrogenase
MREEHRYDVAIIGGGLAGLTLARHLLLHTEKTVLLLERRPELPSPRQKYGESTVQLAGYYFSKVLDMEEHLWWDQTMKYNLRFYWKSAARDNSRFEDFSQLYIRQLSNVVSHQLDRNLFEAELLRRNLANPRFTLKLGATDLDVQLATADPGSTPGPHELRFKVGGERQAAAAGWVVDSSGRAKTLARRRGLTRPSAIRHGAVFMWVDGLLNIDKLTDASPKAIRLKPERRHLGHVPFWLATNHFCGEGFWFWVIPLQHKTSLGLVYDRELIDFDDVRSPEKLTEWVCRELPLFARDLPQRKVLDFWGLKDYAHDCAQTISTDRWAMAGEAGRFTDPLYSPGSDLISLYNTMIVDAIETDDPVALAGKVRLYEQMMRAFYGAYVPSYAKSYDVLGDPEAFYLKYVWELSIYFGFYVFPFANDLFTNRRFDLMFLEKFSQLGALNRDLQAYLSGFYQWKKRHALPRAEPLFADFTDLPALKRAESCFYQIGVTVEEARQILDDQLASLFELARFAAAPVAAAVLDDPRALENRNFIEGIDLATLRFDPEEMRRRLDACAGCTETFAWSFDPLVMQRFRTPRIAGMARASEEPAAAEELEAAAGGTRA